MQNDFSTDVRRFVVANFLLGREYPLCDDSSFMEEGLIDSTGILELVSHLEETYGIEILEQELTPDNLDSISRIAAFLARKLPPAIDEIAVNRQPTPQPVPLV